jgi:hypothetical protein
MKKILLLGLLIFMGSHELFAQYPIPSFGAVVDTAGWFAEGFSMKRDPVTDARREVHVRLVCSTTTHSVCQASVWVFSLDGQDVLGPYRMEGGDEIKVGIDDREWGVAVESYEKVIVDVWIDEISSPPGTPK